MIVNIHTSNNDIICQSAIQEEYTTSKGKNIQRQQCCPHFDEKIKKLLSKTTSLQAKLSSLRTSDHDITPESSFEKDNEGINVLKEALSALSSALILSLHKINSDKDINSHTKHRVIEPSNSKHDTFSNEMQPKIQVNGEQESWRMLYRSGDDKISFAQLLRKVIKDDYLATKALQTDSTNQDLKSSQSSKQVLIKGPDGNKKYCICDDGMLPVTKDMIGCDFCDMWYHPNCIGLTKNEADMAIATQWPCPICDKLCDCMFVKLPEDNKIMKRKENKQKIQRLEIEQSFDLIENTSDFTSNTVKLRKRTKDTTKLSKHRNEVNRMSSGML